MVEGALEQKKEDWSKIQRKNTKIRGKNTFPHVARPCPSPGYSFAAFLQAQVTLLQLYRFILLVA
jgi:hypothetical protein